MSGDAELYERDFVAWTEAQAARLRAAASTRANLPIDWENMAEEIESLGRDNKRELRSHLTTIIEHLLKLCWSRAAEPRPGWRATITRERQEIESLLEESPSIRQHIPELLDRAHRSARKIVIEELVERGELARSDAKIEDSPAFRAGEVLDDWWPEPKSDL